MTSSIRTDTSVLAEFFSTTGPEDIYRPGEPPKHPKSKVSTRLIRACKDVTSALSPGLHMKAKAKTATKASQERVIKKSQPIITKDNDSESPRAMQVEEGPMTGKASSTMYIPAARTSDPAIRPKNMSGNFGLSFQQRSSFSISDSARSSGTVPSTKLSRQLSPRDDLKEIGNGNIQAKRPTSKESEHVAYLGLGTPPELLTSGGQVCSDEHPSKRSGLPLDAQTPTHGERSSFDSDASLSRSLRMLDSFVKKEKTQGLHVVGKPHSGEAKKSKYRQEVLMTQSSQKTEGEQACSAPNRTTQSGLAVPPARPPFRPTALDDMRPSKPQSFTGRLRQAAANESVYRVDSAIEKPQGTRLASTAYSDDPDTSDLHNVERENFPVLLCQPSARAPERRILFSNLHQLPDPEIVPSMHYAAGTYNASLVARLKSLEDRNEDLERALLQMLASREKPDWTDRH